MTPLSIYEAEDALLATKENHKELIASNAEFVKDIFFYEGSVSGLASTLATEGFVTFENKE